jgi:hypothetical protein
MLVYSTYIGGSSDDYGYGIAVDGNGNAYVTGRTYSSDYDITPGAFQTTHGGGAYDVFVTKLNASGSGLIYSTYIGGGNNDEGSAIAVDNIGNAYVTGWTSSNDYDVTAGAFQTTNDGTWDVFVTKLCPLDITLTSGTGTDNQTVCINSAITNITYSSTGATGATFSGLPTGVTGNYTGGDITISGMPTDSGTFNYMVTLTGGCDTTTATGTIVVNSCTGLEEVSSASSWLIYPNPTSATFTLQTEKGGEFELMDMHGRVLKVFKMQNPIEQIRVNLSNGIYFIREKASGVTQRVIIE